jgi:hypothetical protein
MLAVSQNHLIDPIAAAHATPIDRSDFKHSFFHHKPAAAMAPTGLSVHGRSNLSHKKISPSG